MTRPSKEDVLRHLEVQSYDRYYQDIEALGVQGHIPTHRSWESIASLVDWKDQSVVDMGCFHGYFCFKVEQAGARSILGLDHSEAVLKTAGMIAALQDSRTTFRIWNGGEPVPECDVALCLNMLHHCKNVFQTLENMNCRRAVFEIKPEYEPVVTKYFEPSVRRASHRDDRLVLLATKRPEPLPGFVATPPGHSGQNSDYMIALLLALLENYVREAWARWGTEGTQGRPLRIAIFGAGKHTQWLEQLVKGRSPQPQVMALLDDRGESAPARFGLQAIRPESFDPSTVDAIFLSSDTLIDTLQARCIALYGQNIRLLNFYSGFPPGPYPKDYFDSRLQRLL